MKHFITIILVCLISPFVLAQEAVPDSFCVEAGTMIIGNVKSNDFPVNNSLPVYLLGQSGGDLPCFVLEAQTGNLILNPEVTDLCCGEHRLFYTYDAAGGGQPAEINVTIKCPKPNCEVIELDLDPFSGGTLPNQPITYYGCEDNPITYWLPYTMGYTYSWSNSASAPMTNGTNPAEVIVTWPNPGNYTLSVLINTGTSTSTLTFNIVVLAAPIASFTTLTTCVCLNSPISFANTSIGASSYYWDFGDGNNTTQSNPTHNYGSPGTYTVVLYAFNENYDPSGNPLCCCVDTFQLDVVVDEYPGPDVYWISTLCEGDTSKYWTNATNCNMTWTATTANNINIPITYTSIDSDTICVVWPSGPYGNISLQLGNCSPAIWCEKPVTVQVPIISSVASIDGEMTVCSGAKEIYSLPKWNGTTYHWTVTGGMIVSGDSSHQVTIMWGSGTTGTIHVDYWNPFLQGLPNHNEENCKGIADKTVSIKPPYDLLPLPTTACTGSSTLVSTDTYAAAGFGWSVSPSIPGFTNWSNQSNTINWPATSNVYTICVYPINSSAFCVDTLCTTIQTLSVPPPDSISGPKEICPGETYTYFAHTTASNTKFNWTVINGMIVSPASGMGNPLVVKWNAAGPYALVVNQSMLSDPFCTSPSISCPISRKQLAGPVSINPGPSCVNTQQTVTLVTPPQPVGTSYEWLVIPSTYGSVVSGQGTSNPNIQWNNTPGMCTLRCIIRLCSDSIIVNQPINLDTPTPVTISQLSPFCLGGTTQLSIGAGTYSSVLWSPPGSGNTVTVSSQGLYTVTVTNMSGCVSNDSYQLTPVAGPLAYISTGDPETICVPISNPPQTTTTYTALTGVGYTYEWYCNGVLQTGFTGPSFPHVITPGNNTTGVYNYQAKVTDANGCYSWSNVRQVIHSSCNGGCQAQSHSVSINPVQSIPICNQYTFNTTTTGPVTLVSWSYNDPFGTINFAGPSNPVFTFSQAGVYQVCVYYTVPSVNGGNCSLYECVSVSVPLVADFDYDYTPNCREVKFTSLSTWLPGLTLDSLKWNYGDGMMETTTNPTYMPIHTYALPGIYPVTLTIYDNGCIVSKTISVPVLGPVMGSMTVSDTVVCVGDPVMFGFTGASSQILYYLYNFGDASINAAAAPSHSYLSPGLFNASLTTTDVYNCNATYNQSILVHPAFMPDTIIYSPSLTVCNGESTTLTAPLGSVSYAWSNGMNTNSITVNMSGWYHVTVTDANGCVAVTDSVEVIVLPPFNAQISGSHYICDQGCIDLSASSGFNYSWQWHNANGLPIFGEVNMMHQECSFTPNNDSVFVVITDDNGCTDTSNWHTISVATSPVVNISTVGDLCAGSPNILTASAFGSNIKYLWSNGMTTPTIIVSIAGLYSVTATDSITGCNDMASVLINPLPDFCIMPAGCYEACNPDTICGPPGMQSYQWLLDGLPIVGANMECFITSQSGTYSLIATNAFGCTDTSDVLILELIPCCEEYDTDIIATPITIVGEECCVSLSYANAKDSLMTMTLSTTGANIGISPGSLVAPFIVVGSTSTTITIGNINPLLPLPKDTLATFAVVCAQSVMSTSVVVNVDWNWVSYGPLCQDTFSFMCNLSGDCVYIESDTIICKLGGTYTYEVTVCNSASNTWTFGYLDFNEILPAGVSITPNTVTTSIPPGGCQTFVLVVSGTNLANQDLCYQLVAHESDPTEDPTALCCSLDSAHCIFIPGCTTCDSIAVTDISPMPDDSCCYAITFNNYYQDGYYGQVSVCALYQGVSISSINNNTTWGTVINTPSMLKFNYNGGFIPMGYETLPVICVDESDLTFNDIAIKWIHLDADGNEAICSDTITLECNNDCGYWEEVSVICDPATGGYDLHLIFHNDSPFTIYSATIHVTNPALSSYQSTVSFPGGVPPNGTFGTVTIPIPSSSLTLGDTLCYFTTLHNEENNQSTYCCQFKSLSILPDCDEVPPCLCDNDFYENVNLGMTVTTSGLTATFMPAGNLSDCDEVIWEIIGVATYITIGNQSVTHTFATKGSYEVCMTVIRTDDNGKQCMEKVTDVIKVKSNANLAAYPNPTNKALMLEYLTGDKEILTKRWALLLGDGRVVMSELVNIKGSFVIPLDLTTLNPGIYYLRVDRDDESEYKKIIKVE